MKEKKNPTNLLTSIYKKTFLILVSSLIVIVLFTVSAIYQFHQSIQNKTIQSYSSQIVTAKANEIKEWINSLIVEMQRIAERQNIKTMKWNAISNELEQIYYDRESVYGLMFLILPDGSYYIAGQGKASKNLMGREYFIKVFLKNEKFAISKPSYSKSTGAPKFSIAVPIKNNNQTVGILGANVNLTTLSKITQDIKIGERGYGFIIDENGEYIAHPNNSFTMKVNLINYLDSTKQYDALKQLKDIKGVTNIVSTNDTNEEIIFTNIPNTPNWKLGIAVSASEINQPRFIFLKKIFLILISCILIMSLTIKIILNNALKKSIQRIEEAYN